MPTPHARTHVLLDGLLVDLLDVDDHARGRLELAAAEVALEVLVLLVLHQDGLVVKGAVAVEAPDVGRLLPLLRLLLPHG